MIVVGLHVAWINDGLVSSDNGDNTDASPKSLGGKCRRHACWKHEVEQVTQGLRNDNVAIANLQ